MTKPSITGIKFLDLIKEDTFGELYRAENTSSTPPLIPDPKTYTVRVFKSITLPFLVEKTLQRFGDTDYPSGAIPMKWDITEEKKACIIMPYIETSLNDSINDYPQASSWSLIYKIAEAISSLHRCQVAHTNIKPGNILLKNDSNILLSEIAMAHMPDASVNSYTDALLYAPPQQLRKPDGHHHGEEYSWDVYAFGTLAYRILTGKFPRCDDKLSQLARQTKGSTDQDISINTEALASKLENTEIHKWPNKPRNSKERSRRKLIERCLNIHPDKRFNDLPEFIRAWSDIDQKTSAHPNKRSNDLPEFIRAWNDIDQKASIQRYGRHLKKLTKISAALAIGAFLLMLMLFSEKSTSKVITNDFKSQISVLEKKSQSAQEKQAVAEVKQAVAETTQLTEKLSAATNEKKIRTYLEKIELTNDYLIKWITSTKNQQLPALQTNQDQALFITTKLLQTLEQTKNDPYLTPLRARIQLQLAELSLFNEKPAQADEQIDQAVLAWDKAGLDDPSYKSRIVLARLVAVMQSLDLKQDSLTKKLLPKAQKATQSHLTSPAGNDTEARRIKAVMQIINGRTIQDTDPAKALEHFELALKGLKGIHAAIPEHTTIHTDLAKHALHSSKLADSLERVNDAARLRSEAATHLQWLIKNNPELSYAKVKLASIEILAAEVDLRSGENSECLSKLKVAERLLKDFTSKDTEPDGVTFQRALASGLSAITLRDQGRTTQAAENLNHAIELLEKIVKANPEEQEPTYRLAVFNWQSAGLAGSRGNNTKSMQLSEKAANLMQQLLKQGAGNRETRLRRSLAYLYGDLGYTSVYRGKKSSAAKFFKQARDMWQSLIDKNGTKEEYTNALTWCKSQYSENSTN